MGFPLTLSEFSAALDAIGGFERRPLVAVATSGGPDSLALAILADRWARARGGVAWTVTVDHRLRRDSGGEARQVGVWLAARGIPHAITSWDGPKPTTGLQRAAREARYGLLGEWCRAQGCLHLLTAHHREDQAETFLIRRRAQSGPDGLAAMAAVRELPGCRLVRPLLGVPRARLAALLDAEDQPSISDPSNRDPRFERARLRSDPVSDREAAFFAARQYGFERAAREQALDRLIARDVVLHPAGFAVVAPPAGEFAEALLARVARTVGGGVYPPRRERTAQLAGALAGALDRARTLGGCRFVPWRGRLLVLREPAAAGLLRLGPGMTAVWDRRFVAALPDNASSGLVLSALGSEGVAALDRSWRRAAAAEIPPLVFPSLPAFRDAGNSLICVPHLGWRAPTFGGAPTLRYRPAAPLTGAGFTVV